MVPGISDNDLLSLPELATYLRVAQRTAYLWAQQGKIPGFKLGSSWRFKLSEIDAWVESQRSGPEVSPVSRLTDRTPGLPSKYAERVQQQQAEEAMISDCEQEIMRKLEDDSRDVWTTEDIDDAFGAEIAREAMKRLRRAKQIAIGEEQGLRGQKVLVIRRRN